MISRLSLAFATLLLVGCPEPTDPGTDDPVVDPDPVDIVGAWVDGWDTQHSITEDRWTQGDYDFWLTEWSTDEGWAVAQNDASNEYNPELWSRFEWVTVDGDLWYCQSAFDAATEQDALAVAAADASDPATTGCGGFAWTRMYVPLEIRGGYTDSWGSTHVVREWLWTTDALQFHITAYDGEAGWAVAQNDADNEWNPELWSKFQWARANGSLFYCQVAYDAADEASASAAPLADASDPATGGCGGFAWTELTPTP